MLDQSFERSSFSFQDIELFTGQPMRIDLNSDKPISHPVHKLGQVEWDFVEAQCKKLEGLGFIKCSSHGDGVLEGRGGKLHQLPSMWRLQAPQPRDYVGPLPLA